MSLPNSHNHSKRHFQVAGKNYTYFDVNSIPNSEKLPFSIKVLLENLLRYEDNKTVTAEDIAWFSSWKGDQYEEKEIAYRPARVLMQDFTGVPAVVDLASMRDAMKELGGDVNKINPLQKAELVIDHSVQVDEYGKANSLDLNTKLEYSRNKERYEFLKWGQRAFSNFMVVPPGTGIVHQVNLEYLSQCVYEKSTESGIEVFPDTVVGTDSHTTMVNGMGVLGWGVGGIEAEAAMLGQPISMLVPKVVGMELFGELAEGTTATDLVLYVVEALRKHGVVGKFVEFYGDGLAHLSLADRATIGNMAPEYGATCGMFPIDKETINYLRLSDRDEHLIDKIEHYYRAQGMFYEGEKKQVEYNETLALDLSEVKPSLAGPKRPQDRVLLNEVKSTFRAHVTEEKTKSASIELDGQSVTLNDGAVVIAAITSCTNTSNPSVMLGAGLVAKKAAQFGLKVKPWVKTSLAPGSKVVTRYLQQTGLDKALESMNFFNVGYGCTTCIGNSGPLRQEIAEAINEHDLSVTSVLSGNRNFEGRVHAQVKMNFLASPPLVVAYAIAGTVDINLQKDPIGTNDAGDHIYLKDIWPSQQELAAVIGDGVNRDQFQKTYAEVFAGDENWQKLKAIDSDSYAWPESTYVRKPPFFDNIGSAEANVASINNARVLALLGDSVTTDHISPAGSIAKDSPAAKYLQAQGVDPLDFNSYGSRRGNHEVMMRGTFANIRLRNQIAPGTEGGITVHIPSAEQMSIYDAAMKYQQEGISVVIISGKEYGTGSSRDWAAKGCKLLGVKAVLAESFERIHRTNLVGMGILPLQFESGESAHSHGLSGHESYDFLGVNNGESKTVEVRATKASGEVVSFHAKVRIDTPQEIEYYQNGGILRYVLRNLAAA